MEFKKCTLLKQVLRLIALFTLQYLKLSFVVTTHQTCRGQTLFTDTSDHFPWEPDLLLHVIVPPEILTHDILFHDVATPDILPPEILPFSGHFKDEVRDIVTLSFRNWGISWRWVQETV